MKKIYSLLTLLGLGMLPLSVEAAYPVTDARANMILQQILKVDQKQLSETGRILGVNNSQLDVLQAIRDSIGSPTASQSGSPTSGASSAINSVLSNSKGSGSGDHRSTLINAAVGQTGASLTSAAGKLSLGGSLGQIEGLMESIPGYEDFDIGDIFSSAGRINTFIDGDFGSYKESFGDPSKRIADELKRQVYGAVDDSGILSNMERSFGRRMLNMDRDDFNGNRSKILGDVAGIFMARVLDNVTESAQRNEVLAEETQAAYEEASKATTVSEQMAAQNRIDTGNNMIELEKMRVMNDTAAAQVTLQGKELDVLKFQENDRQLNNLFD